MCVYDYASEYLYLLIVEIRGLMYSMGINLVVNLQISEAIHTYAIFLMVAAINSHTYVAQITHP